MRPVIVLHQEEPRAHCTSVRSDNRSEDFIPVPNSSQGTVGYDMETLSRLSHVLSVNLLSSVKRTGANGGPANSGVLSRMPIELHGAGL
ncbi:hypothetical protein SKAU_G00152540 [Synaphobranchus kaupii]|uniref:Uncharacterized protein n=1 Tax=Synaphobranchus kaupii TaxID=118154 RepID=A0A9Q1FGX8_SYNKA|nr:hypothetical protein SKAU_G00152540 [Synaphobranchus kaupii]